jgi:hypothetical protein
MAKRSLALLSVLFVVGCGESPVTKTPGSPPGPPPVKESRTKFGGEVMGQKLQFERTVTEPVAPK